MERVVFILAIASLTLAQQQYVKDPKEAAIISEKRYLSGNGQFGSAYTQEDGVQFTEESDQDGNRRGAYSYIDPNGQRRTVTYTAGKNGFQASGDHLPVAPPAPAAPAPVAPQAAPVAPQSAPASVASRQYNVQESDAEGQYHPIYDDVAYWEQQKKSGSWRAAPAPAAPAPAPAPQQWSAPAATAPRQWSAPAAPAPQWEAPAAPAPQWEAPAAPAPQWRAPAPPAPLWNAAPAPAPAPQQWSAPAAPVQRWSQAAAAPAPQPQSWEYNSIVSTEAPHRFFPPGKLDLNRSPDGFTYSFSKS